MSACGTKHAHRRVLTLGKAAVERRAQKQQDQARSPVSNLDSIDDALPAVVLTKDRFLVSPTLDCEKFLDDDLSVRRVEDIAPHLWLAGRPYPPRPLNIQRVLKRDIVATTDASLHLVWTSQATYVKALPRYLVSKNFYEQRLRLPHPYRPALGLLFTYMALIPSELDFALAHELHMLPTGYEWDEWRKLARQILDEYPGNMIYSHVPRRYIYGELRLSGLDKIYQYRLKNLFSGYSRLTGYLSITDIFASNLRIITAATVYMVVILTAMQVGLATDSLMSNDSFQRACYGFTAFAITSPVIALGALVGFPAFMLPFVFVSNWWGNGVAHRHRLRAIGVTSLSDPQPHRADDVPETLA